MGYPTKRDKELYQKDINAIRKKTGDPNAFVVFNDPDFERTRARLREERKKAK